MIKILFVCLGNICRSPAAEAIMNHLIAEKGLSDQIECDSAGTSGAHEGENADETMRHAAKERGFEITSRSRQVTLFDLEEFDYIIAMDQNNFCNLKDLIYDDAQLKKIQSICSYCCVRTASEVPDPYMGGKRGFDIVLDILEDACIGLLNSIISKHNLQPK